MKKYAYNISDVMIPTSDGGFTTHIGERGGIKYGPRLITPDEYGDLLARATRRLRDAEQSYEALIALRPIEV